MKNNNKMENKTIYSFVALGIIALLGVSAFVSANTGFGLGNGIGQDLTDEEKVDIESHREAVKEAIESQDYDLWKSLMEERIESMKEKLTEDNFDKIVERHQQRSETREELKSLMEEARESGDFSEVREYIQENDLQKPVMKHLRNKFMGS